jgi:hypothetical protein
MKPEFENFKIPELTYEEKLARHMMNCVLGAFEIGYELGKLNKEEKKK